MGEDRAWLIEQIKERLRYYGSFTSLGLDPERLTEAAAGTVALAASPPPASSLEGEGLEAIREDIGDCKRCRLHAGRRNIVFGVGNPRAELVFVGEGPGYDEDVQGLPFVGKAGQLLTKIIEAIGMQREDVYIANIVKCRPPDNRDPAPEEIAECRPFVERQIRSIGPKVICALGRVAAQSLLSTEKPLRALRGGRFDYGDALVVPTYHPAYLLRNPAKKRECWKDMKLVRRLLHESR